MYFLRPTLRLAKRMGIKLTSGETGRSTTALGDWYAGDIVLDRRQYVLCTCENARLSVVVPASPYATFPERLPAALAQVLAAIRIPKAAISREIEAMYEIFVAKSASGSMTATLKEWKYQLRAEAERGRFPHHDLLAAALILAEIPTQTLGWRFPCEAAQAIFHVGKVRVRRMPNAAEL